MPGKSDSKPKRSGRPGEGLSQAEARAWQDVKLRLKPDHVFSPIVNHTPGCLKPVFKTLEAVIKWGWPGFVFFWSYGSPVLARCDALLTNAGVSFGLDWIIQFLILLLPSCALFLSHGTEALAFAYNVAAMILARYRKHGVLISTSKIFLFYVLPVNLLFNQHCFENTPAWIPEDEWKMTGLEIRTWAQAMQWKFLVLLWLGYVVMGPWGAWEEPVEKEVENVKSVWPHLIPLPPSPKPQTPRSVPLPPSPEPQTPRSVPLPPSPEPQTPRSFPKRQSPLPDVQCADSDVRATGVSELSRERRPSRPRKLSVIREEKIKIPPVKLVPMNRPNGFPPKA